METDLNTEKILVYIGTSLSLAEARKILPNAIFHPPAKQGDIVSDVVRLEPNRIILIDGCFDANLSVWHKELVWALQYPHLHAIYGAASMGALRASELDFLGMVGIGQIYEWYRDGVTEDDSEVAVHYATREGQDGPLYYVNNVPLCDIRAGVEQYEKEYPDEPVTVDAREFLERMRAVYYEERTPDLCEKAWNLRHGVPFPRIEQKAIDATLALSSFREYQPVPIQKPTPDDLSRFFQALYERDRRITLQHYALSQIGTCATLETRIPQQHVDAFVLLHNPEFERICWDSANQDLALMLCDQLCVTVTLLEIERENIRFQQRSGIETLSDFQRFLETNGWSRAEYDRLQIQNARIRKLQHANTVAKMYRRNTQAIIDYLRTHQAFDYWAKLALEAEKKIQASGVDDWLGVNLETTAFGLLAAHFEREGLELKMNQEEYLLETGFSNLTELSVAVSRITAGKEQDAVWDNSE